MIFQENSFSNLTIRTIGQKEIYIFDIHNFAFPIWALAKDFENPPELVTLDTHADTREFLNIHFRKKYPNASNKEILELRKKRLFEIDVKNYESVLKGTLEIANDEHITAAQELGIISTVHSINHSLHDSKDGEIKFYCSLRIPAEDVLPHNFKPNKWFVENCLEDEFFEKIGFKTPVSKFILDIDCDYITKEEALCPKNIEVFSELVRKCELITIAREPSFCQNVRSEKIEKRLLEIISEILG
ncbi:MAG: hypothetical protein DWQ06_04405 [Calditrichaeota bacterium]|nr:MAG: hypothetical protein DWQ06_04405 [Calditrichota bacterium]